MAATAINWGGNSDRALYYTRFVQLVDAFLKQTATRGLFMEQQLIDGAKSGRFPVFGRMGGTRHTAGDNLLEGVGYLETMSKTEIEVFPDRPIISPDFVDLFDDRLNSIAFRDAVLAQKTNFLARAEDEMTLYQIARAAKGTLENIAGQTGQAYAETTLSTTALTASDIENFLLNAQVAFDDNHVPAEGRYAFAPPVVRSTILADATLANKMLDVDVNAGTNGSYRRGQVMEFAGFKLIFTTNMPNSNYSADGVGYGLGGAPAGTTDTQYPAVNLTKVGMLAAHSTAIGKVTVGSTGLEVEQEYKIEYQGTLHLAKLHTGVQCIRPEATAVIELT